VGNLPLRFAPRPAGRLLPGMNGPRLGITGSFRAATLPAVSFAMTTGWFSKSFCGELFPSLGVRGGLCLLKAVHGVTC